MIQIEKNRFNCVSEPNIRTENSVLYVVRLVQQALLTH